MAIDPANVDLPRALGAALEVIRAGGSIDYADWPPDPHSLEAR